MPTTANHTCRQCLTSGLALDLLRSVSSYRGLIKSTLLRFKYENEDALGTSIADTMFERFSLLFDLPLSLAFFDAIVVPPSDWTSYKKRGYNPAAMIADRLSKRSGIPFLGGAITKTRSTPPQNSLNIKQRKTNLKGSFAPSKTLCRHVRGRRVLLVDDIYTTGATLAECTRVLKKKAGVFEVVGFTFARTLKPR